MTKTSNKTKKKTTGKKPRRTASDSNKSAQEVMAHASIVIEPPAHMTMSDASMYYFRDIINERANVDWAPHDVAIAAKLARYMAREDELSGMLDDEGPTVTGAQGGIAKNPTATVLADVSSKIIALRRSLCLHALGANPGLKSSQIGKGRGQRRAVQDAADVADPLIARPS